ncbi:MAG: hypothetical protein ACOX17_05415 [Christensenellales bacterium]|jgi:hypothetical protein
MQFLKDMYHLITLFYNQSVIDKTIGVSVKAIMEGSGRNLGIKLLSAALVMLAAGLLIDYILYFTRNDVRFSQSGLIEKILARIKKRIV